VVYAAADVDPGSTDRVVWDKPRGSTGAKSLTLADIASLTGAVPREGTALSHRITNIAPIDRARPSALTFIDNPKFADALADFTMTSGFDEDITRAIPNGALVEVDPTAERPCIRVM
jgi:UDP-3-O-[3-hydroxymyristoyl] glucosamine N-acyltransferase